ncbi:MAG: hypothetical protein ACOY9C_11895 [Pseudomonadota bacterium]
MAEIMSFASKLPLQGRRTASQRRRRVLFKTAAPDAGPGPPPKARRERSSCPAHSDGMGKWVAILLAAIVALAIVGFLVDAARAIAGFLLVLCLIGLAAQFFWNRARKSD